MRLVELRIENAPPVRVFGVTELSDVIVIAGPNGVGKTRLLQAIVGHLRGGGSGAQIGGLIEATNRQEREAWGKDRLDLTAPEDVQLLRTTLQRNRSRNSLVSSIINFESDRTFQSIQPLQFQWDIQDPFSEEVSWDIGFTFMRDRFQDTVHSMFRLIEAQKQGIANRAVQLRREGRDSMKLDFSDPMEPFKEVFARLLGPKELADLSARTQRIEYREGGATLDFFTLSSGEQEVVKIAFDFLLRRPRDCIVFFDEPELHLHPELSYRLIQTLQEVGRNQFVFATQSPDIITASLDKSVVFISPPSENGEGQPINQAVPVSEADETNRALRLLGHSVGIIALGRRIILIEGESSSLDKQVYGSIIRSDFPSLVLVPSGGKHALESFGEIYERVLSRALWGVEFFMLCDRDSAPPEGGDAVPGESSERLRVLSRYHLENYFLDESVWALAFEDIERSGSWLRSPDSIRETLRNEARSLVSFATALAVASKFRMAVGNLGMMPKDCHGKSQAEVQKLLLDEANREGSRLRDALDPSRVSQEVDTYYGRLEASLDADTDEWKTLIPGKPLLGRFASRAGFDPGRARTMYINAARRAAMDPFAEVREIFATFANSA